MEAMVFGAGFGTRLRPLTEVLPKPLVPVGNRPLVAYAIDHLGGAGVNRFVVNAHHLSAEMERAAEALTPQGATLEVVVERKILGTGGGLKNGWRGRLTAQEVLVQNGDILFAPDLARLTATHRSTGAIATMVLRSDPRAEAFGPIDVDMAQRRVTGILGAADRSRGVAETFMFTGVHLFDARAFDDLPEDGCIIRHSYRRWLERGEFVAAVIDESPWLDLGTPQSYLEANISLATGARAQLGVSRDPVRGIVHGSAVLGAGAHVTGSVIGQGAAVGDSIRVDRSVVWPNTVVTADLVQAIAWPGGVMQVAR